MQAHVAQTRPTTASPLRTSAWLTVSAAALATAFVYAPQHFAASTPGGGFANQSALINALRKAFVGYWGSGDRDYPTGMARIVDYWFRYHVAKAAIAALLLAVLVALGIQLWKAYLTADGPTVRGSRIALASAASVDMALALFAVAVVMANVQGATAPFASLLSMLPTSTPSGPFAETLGQVKQHLTGYPKPDAQSPPALQVMVDDFGRYHVVLAIAAVTVAAIFIVLSVLSWRRRRTPASEQRARRLFVVLAACSALVAAGVIVIAVANAGTASNPAPALLSSFEGGW